MTISFDPTARFYPPTPAGPGPAQGTKGTPSAAPTASRPAPSPPPPNDLTAERHAVEQHNDSAGAAMARRNVQAGQPAPGQPAAAATGGAAPAAPSAGGPRPFRPLTADQLRAAIPRIPKDKVDEYLPLVNDTMRENQINTPERQAAFLAHLAHESADLSAMRERGSGAAYEPGTKGGKILGNTQPGDGERFKGRGPIQLTGRANYEAASRALGVDLAADPDRVANDPAVGFRAAGWFWRTRGLNNQADRGDMNEMTRRIVGRANHRSLPDREARHEQARRALGVQ